MATERLGVSHRGTQAAPCGIGVTVGKLDKIDGVLYIFVEAVDRHLYLRVGILILAQHTHIQHGQRLGTYFFGEQEIFVETEAVAQRTVGA